MSIARSFLLIGLSVSGLGQAQEKVRILPLPKAPQVIPPHKTIEDAQNDLQRKRKLRIDEEKKLSPAPKKEPTIMEKLIEAETVPFKDLSLRNQISFFIPHVQTTGNFRKDYQAEPSLAYKLEYKISSPDLYQKTSMWLGLRVQSFNLSGTYRNINGRMNFLYYGPSFTYLTILSENSAPSGKSEKLTDQSKQIKPSHKLNGVGFSMGVAALSRYARISGDEDGPEELSQGDLLFDTPGTWMEAFYAQIFSSTISMEYTIGLQAGDSKLFIYAAFGMGLWI